MKKISIHNALNILLDKNFQNHFTTNKREFENLFLSLQSGNSIKIKDSIKNLFSVLDKEKLKSIGYELIFNTNLVFSGKDINEEYLNSLDFDPKLIMLYKTNFTLIK